MIKRLRRKVAQWWRERDPDSLLLLLYEMRSIDLSDPDRPQLIRRFSDEALHHWLAKAREPKSRSMLERELRRREAWAAPAGRAYWISVAAFCVSVAALLVSIAVHVVSLGSRLTVLVP